MQLARIIAVCLAATLPLGGVACNSGEFAGSGAKTETKKAAAKKDSPDTEKPQDKGKPEKPEKEKPSKDKPKEKPDKKPVDPGDEGDGAPLDDKTPDEPLFKDLTDNAPAGPGEDTDTSNGQPFIDLLGGLLSGPGIDSGDLGTQPNDNEIIFGDTKTFHLGDGQMTQSSCIEGISPYPVAGKQYLFEFEVLGDGAVSVNIGTVCGVDYSDTNLVFIAQNGSPVGTPTPLPIGASSAQIPSTNLTKGKYSIGVESRIGTSDPQGNPNDADDYILGKVKISSQGAKIKIGKVYVNP